ncbi:MAG: prolyl oligopeptidase family serine peptidase [Actinobacteria bacterium]|nr:prolyl oligopeptidase family serine peptidase [Actinomycetota bacterium]
MTTPSIRLPVVCDGLRLSAGACVPEEPRGLVVLLHGIPSVNPPDPDDRGYPGVAEGLAAGGWAAAWADMRAVRASPGYFSIEGWVRDARAVVDAARSLEGAGDLPVALVGSSAGGAVSAEVVRRGAPVNALAMLAAPATWITFAGDPAAGVRRVIDQAGMKLAPGVEEDPRAWADEFERVSAEDTIAHVKIPTLIMHGSADDVVPVDHAHRLANRAPKADLRIIEGAHHQLRRIPEALDILDGWLRQVLR